MRARFRKWLNEEYWMEDYLNLGMKVGKNCDINPGLMVDVSHCWLIEIKDNVTIAPQVYLLAHDTSTLTNEYFRSTILFTGHISMILFEVNGALRGVSLYNISNQALRTERVLWFLVILYLVSYILFNIYIGIYA